MDHISRIREEHNALSKNLEGLTREREEIESRIRDAKAQLSELETAMRVLDRLSKPGPLFGEATPTPESTQPKAIANVTVKEAMEKSLNDLPGSTLRVLVERANGIYGTELNIKTAGNALWSLKNDGAATRKGRRWFPSNGIQTDKEERKEKEDAPSYAAAS